MIGIRIESRERESMDNYRGPYSGSYLNGGKGDVHGLRILHRADRPGRDGTGIILETESDLSSVTGYGEL